MIRQHPRPPLFPYATLSQSLGVSMRTRQVNVVSPAVTSTSLAEPSPIPEIEISSSPVRPSDSAESPSANCSGSTPMRSEEHTSELQSRQYLVCRLLLENKKYLRPRTTSGPHPPSFPQPLDGP